MATPRMAVATFPPSKGHHHRGLPGLPGLPGAEPPRSGAREGGPLPLPPAAADLRNQEELRAPELSPVFANRPEDPAKGAENCGPTLTMHRTGIDSGAYRKGLRSATCLN